MQTRTLQTIEALVEEIAPEYSFIYATLNMANVRADDARFPLCYLDEITGATYTVDAYGIRHKLVNVEIYFLRRATMQGEATEREMIRATIEEEVVHPFIEAVAANWPNTTTINADYPPALFDDNDVGICLRFQIEESLC